MPPAIVIVTPVFEDRVAAAILFKELHASCGADVYIVAVDDGSVRFPLPQQAIEAAGIQGAIVRLRRNVGHQRAIAIGLNYVAENFPAATCVVMDSDGEDVPNTIADLLSGLGRDDIDVVVAQRKSRIETLRFQVFYAIYKVIFRILSGHRISFGNFMALSPFGVKRISALPELWVHVASSVLVSRLRVELRSIDRGPRYAGRSKMNFSGLVLHGLRALMVFAEDVLVRVGLLCAIVATVSVLSVAAIFVLKLVGLATPGWFSVALGILLLALLQTGALTLMTLMLSGVVRNNNLLVVDYRSLIDSVDLVGPRA